jgi:hypothetical protein
MAAFTLYPLGNGLGGVVNFVVIPLLISCADLDFSSTHDSSHLF